MEAETTSFIPEEGKEQVYDYTGESFNIKKVVHEIGIDEKHTEFNPENDRVQFSEQEKSLYDQLKGLIESEWKNFDPNNDVLLQRYLRALMSRESRILKECIDMDELINIGKQQKERGEYEADAYKEEQEKLYRALGIESGLKSEDALRCFEDARRTKRFFKTIFEKIEAGDKVLEAGAGTGILAIAAAKAGAKEITSVEINPFTAVLARRVIKKCEEAGIIPKGTVKISLGDATEFRPSQEDKFDALISENLYTGQFYEVGIQITNHLTRFVDTDQGKVIPKGMLSGIELASLPEEVKREIGHRTDAVTKEYIKPNELDKKSGSKFYDYFVLDDQEALGLRNRVVEVATKKGLVDALNIFSLVQMSDKNGDVILRGEADFLANDHLVILERPLPVDESDEVVIELSYRGGDRPGQANIKVTNSRTGGVVENIKENNIH